MKHQILSLLLVLLTIKGYSQPLLAGIDLFDNGSESERFNDVYHRVNDGFLLCGVTSQNQWLLAINDDRQIEWQSANVEGDLRAVIEADNGDVLSSGREGNRYSVIRLTHEGELVWNRTYIEGVSNSIIELKQGDFVTAGSSLGHGYLIRIDGEGNVRWSRTYGELNEQRSIKSMRETENGVVMAGSISRGEGSPQSGWIQKVDDGGNLAWSREYRFLDNSLPFKDLISLPGGGFALLGYGNDNFILSVINDDGGLDRQIALDLGEGSFIPFSLDKLSNNRLIFAGEQWLIERGENWTYPLLVCTDMEGAILWREDFTDIVPRRILSNHFEEVIVFGRDEIAAAGIIKNWENNRGYDGLFVRFDPDIPGPQIFYRLPEDSLHTELQGDSIRFIVRCRDREGHNPSQFWFRNGTELEPARNDTLIDIAFSEIRSDTIECRLVDDDGTTSTGWIISVRDLFIASYSPDILSLSLRRGTSQTFSLDTVRAVEGDPVEYQWTLTNLDNFEREDAGTEPRSTVEFLRSGNYQMEGLAYRGESSDNVIWTIAVRSAILDFWPRELHLSVPPDSSGEFSVIPFNPESDSLTYRWEVDGDSVGSDSTVTLRFAWNGQAGRITYAVSAIVMDGAEGDTVRWQVTVQDPNATPPTPPSIEGGEICPSTFGILSVSPNPFNSTTTIRYSISRDAYPTRQLVDAYRTRLTVHDLTGREVVRLVDERAQQSPPSRRGPYEVTLNGNDLPAGIYLVRLQAGEMQQVAKLVLVR